MSTEQKAREFELQGTNILNGPYLMHDEKVHVVEFSALQAANERYREMMLKWSEESLKNSERIKEIELEKENIRTHLLSECKNHQETFDQNNKLLAKLERAKEFIVKSSDKDGYYAAKNHKISELINEARECLADLEREDE